MSRMTREQYLADLCPICGEVKHPHLRWPDRPATDEADFRPHNLTFRRDARKLEGNATHVLAVTSLA